MGIMNLNDYRTELKIAANAKEKMESIGIKPGKWKRLPLIDTNKYQWVNQEKKYDYLLAKVSHAGMKIQIFVLRDKEAKVDYILSASDIVYKAVDAMNDENTLHIFNVFSMMYFTYIGETGE